MDWVATIAFMIVVVLQIIFIIIRDAIIGNKIDALQKEITRLRQQHAIDPSEREVCPHCKR